MELELKKGTFREYATVFSKILSAEENVDAVVPDSKPDIGRITDTRAFAEISGKEQRGGKFYFSGTARCFVIYAPEGGGAPECIPVSVAFSVGADPGEELSAGCVARAEVESIIASARDQNPRRINLRVTIRVETVIFSPCEMPVCGDVENGDAFGMELLCEDINAVAVAGMGEKILNVSEAAELGEIKVGNAEFLFWKLRPDITETKLIPGKMVFKGNIDVCALLKTPEDSSSVAHVNLSVPFSGVVDCAGADTDAVGILKAFCFDSELSVSEETGTGRGMLSLKTNITVEACAKRVQMLSAVTDAYSTTHELKASFVSAEFMCEEQRGDFRAEVKGILPAGVGVKTVFFADGSIEEIGLSSGELSAVVKANVLFEGEDGETYSAAKNISIAVSGQGLEFGEIVSAKLTGESYRIVSSDEIEFTAFIEAVAGCGRRETKSILASASVSEREIRGRVPSLTLCGILEGESWWELGKRMRASVDDIMEANGIDEGDPPGDRMLLIPKKPCGRRKTDGGEN
ncbi:MAG: DUF3794 domain-containing protein [Clostridia bacterium]|nr:DUF3794 domain-containing protein [Clostridia bacterium]